MNRRHVERRLMHVLADAWHADADVDADSRGWRGLPEIRRLAVPLLLRPFYGEDNVSSMLNARTRAGRFVCECTWFLTSDSTGERRAVRRPEPASPNAPLRVEEDGVVLHRQPMWRIRSAGLDIWIG